MPTTPATATSGVAGALGADMSAAPWMSAPTKSAFAAQQKALGEKTQAEIDLAKTKSDVESKAQAERGAVLRESADRQRKMLAQSEKDTWSEPAFTPKKESLMDMGKLFSLVATMGVMSGGQGKMASLQAMNAMTGMLKGYQEGRKEEYLKQKEIYDASIKTIQAHNAQILKHLENAMRLETTDREAALIEREQAVRLAGSNSISAKQIEAGRLTDAYENHKGVATMLAKHDESVEDAKIKAEEAARQKAEDREWQATFYAMKQGDTPSMVKQFTGANLGKTEAAQVTNLAKNIGEAEELKDIVEKNNGFVGREGQVNRFVQQYINSMTSGGPEPTAESPSDQEALVFAKRYAAFQVGYERALAGGARGFTVSFQNRWNKLTGSEQFNSNGFVSLMNQFQNEMAKTGATFSPKINMTNLSEMAAEINAQANAPMSPALTKAAPAPAPAPKPMPTGEKLSGYAKDHFGGDEAKAIAYLKTQGYQ